MSAEKEIVNFWLNKQGYFTISNIKVANKDFGVLGIKFKDSVVEEISHIQVNCSITGSITEASNIKKAIEENIKNNFEDDFIKKHINRLIKKFPSVPEIQRIVVLGALPKSRIKEIIDDFAEKKVRVLEFDKLLLSVIDSLDKQYYRHDVIRTLQLLKYLLLGNPELLAELLAKEDILNLSTRKQFLSILLSDKSLKKQFKETDIKDIGEILKYTELRQPTKLADLIEETILTSKTRKPFLKALLEKEKIRKIYKKETEKPKTEEPLSRFF